MSQQRDENCEEIKYEEVKEEKAVDVVCLSRSSVTVESAMNVNNFDAGAPVAGLIQPSMAHERTYPDRDKENS